MAKKTKDQTIKELKLEVKNLRQIIAMMPGNVYWKNAKGIYLGCNSNVADILKLDNPEDIIGKQDEGLLGRELSIKTTSIDSIVIETRKEKCLEEIGFDINGNPATYLTRKTPLYTSKGKVKGILGVSFDITERKAMEENLKVAKLKAEAANRAKSKFLAMISHELRTPLSGILGFTELLKQLAVPDSKKNEYLKYINDSGQYLLSMINSLLDYNKLDTKKYELSLLPVNLKELIENSISMLSGNAKNKELIISLDYPVDAPKYVISDNRTLHQILINLIGNAIKFTAKGYIKVIVNNIHDSANTAKLQIMVADSGIGIPSHETKSIFKQFYQLGNVYTRKVSLTGTGLGLAIVKKLCKLLSATISVTSTPGKGSTFTITNTFKKISDDEFPWLPYATGVRILIINDSYKKNSLTRFLNNTSHEYTRTKEALNLLKSASQNLQPFEIVIIHSDLNDLKPSHLLKTIKTDNDLHQPMTVLVNENKTPTNKHAYFALPSSLKKLNTTTFQTYLKNAWEHWSRCKQQTSATSTDKLNPLVLLVEDNNLIQIIHKHMLEDLGCKVHVTASAKQALVLLKNSYDMLFIDIGLPDIAGFDLIKTIRTTENHKNAKTPIIVLTGYSEEEERQRCIRAGANDVSIKPISQTTLNDLLKTYL
jgi:signal transduction histidine kinase/CheY-like chemotaxis protein